MPSQMDILMALHIVIAVLVVVQLVRGELRGTDIKSALDLINALFGGTWTGPTKPPDPPQ